MQSTAEILAATSVSAIAPPIPTASGASGDGGSYAAVAFGVVKSEKLQAVGLAVPVAQAVSGVAGCSGIGGGLSLLTAQEAKWMKFLPAGIGKPFVGRTFTRLVLAGHLYIAIAYARSCCSLGGLADMGGLSRTYGEDLRLADVLCAAFASSLNCTQMRS